MLRLFGAVAGFAALFRAAGFFVAALLAAAFVAVDFVAAGFFAVDRLAAGRADERLEPVELPRAEAGDSSPGHLPDITFCAASATASAMSEPSLAALDVTDFAAFSAVSAASIPASLIALRAFGLALMAAAAAASPAASISLLIAAFAILSTVALPELFERDEDLDEDFRVLDFAIAGLPCVRRIRHFGAATVPLRRRKGKGNRQSPDVLKGAVTSATAPSNMVSGRRCGRPSALRLDEPPFRPLC